MEINSPFDILMPLLPLLVPILLIQLGLMVYCLVDLARRERTLGPKWLWALIVIFGELLGPVIYLVVGRKE